MSDPKKTRPHDVGSCTPGASIECLQQTWNIVEAVLRTANNQTATNCMKTANQCSRSTCNIKELLHAIKLDHYDRWVIYSMTQGDVFHLTTRRAIRDRMVAAAEAALAEQAKPEPDQSGWPVREVPA